MNAERPRTERAGIVNPSTEYEPIFRKSSGGCFSKVWVFRARLGPHARPDCHQALAPFVGWPMGSQAQLVPQVVRSHPDKPHSTSDRGRPHDERLHPFVEPGGNPRRLGRRLSLRISAHPAFHASRRNRMGSFGRKNKPVHRLPIPPRERVRAIFVRPDAQCEILHFDL